MIPVMLQYLLELEFPLKVVFHHLEAKMVSGINMIMPASLLPQEASAKGAKIIEVNIKPSNYTNNITDIFLEGKATKVMQKLNRII